MLEQKEITTRTKRDAEDVDLNMMNWGGVVKWESLALRPLETAGHPPTTARHLLRIPHFELTYFESPYPSSLV